ncbi:MAG: AlkA N-terminal domain-containing protein [Schumannella sp.]
MSDIAPSPRDSLSLRQFNDTISAVYRATPRELRTLTRRGRQGAGAPLDAAPAPGELRLRLPARAPFDADGLFHFFAAHAIPGLEEGDETGFSRTLVLPGGRAQVRIAPDADRPGVQVAARLSVLSDAPALVARVRRMFDLDADSAAIDESLAGDDALAPLVAAVPGIRIAGSPDGEEALFRTLIGQQISVAAARTVLGRLVSDLGDGAFPRAAVIAERGHEVLRGPAGRIATVRGAARAIAAGDLPLGIETPTDELRASLLALPGIGPWTAGYLAMSVLGAPDILLADDLVVRHSAAARGLPATASALARYGERWAPWRSYATAHLWRARPLRT